MSVAQDEFMSSKLIRSVARYTFVVGLAGVLAACGAADGTIAEEETIGDLSAELSSGTCKPWCPLPEKIIDCQATPQCEECCSGLVCRSVPCCNPYLNTCKTINKRAITNDFSLPPTHGEIESLPIAR
jgi:hypothetical protein